MIPNKVKSEDPLPGGYPDEESVGAASPLLPLQALPGRLRLSLTRSSGEGVQVPGIEPARRLRGLIELSRSSPD